MSIITSNFTCKLRDDFESDPRQKLMQNILARNKVADLRINWERSQTAPHFFSIQTKPRVKITNQKSSGRCWEFAAHNVIRRAMIKQYNLPLDWEFSQSFFFFWDKFERLNYNMYRILDTSQEPLDSRIVQCLLADPTCDGGQWDMFVNIVNKYGMVPKTVFPESENSSKSAAINGLLKRLFRKVALQVRSQTDPVTKQATIDNFRKDVYNLLCKTLGTPPNTFSWEYYDKDGIYNKPDEYSGISALEFYRHAVPFDCEDYVCLINDPRNVYYRLYTVEYLGNVEGGRPVTYLNVPIKDLKDAVYASLRGGEAVWFGCDVGKEKNGVMLDDQLDDTEALIDTDLASTKEERLMSGESLMTHAMIITACNTGSSSIEENPHVTYYEVENSWGDDGVKKPTGGYYCMSDTWFSKWVYEVVVHKKFLTSEQEKTLLSYESQPTPLPLWDPMGSLAGGK